MLKARGKLEGIRRWPVISSKETTLGRSTRRSLEAKRQDDVGDKKNLWGAAGGER